MLRRARQAALLAPVVALVAASVASLPSAGASSAAAPRAAAPVGAQVHRVAVPTTTGDGSRLVAGPTRTVAERTPVATKRFGLVAVTWARGSGAGVTGVELRTRSKGVWSTWQHTDVDDESETDQTRLGTDPVWVGRADGVAARVLVSGSGAPRRVEIELIDPGADPAGAGSSYRLAAPTVTTAAVADGTPSFTPRPAIIARASWGAAAQRTCDAPQIASNQQGIVIHHTAGVNSYTAAQSAGIVRGIQAYHQSSRGWCDIGYNFLVDKYGQVFEGRGGGTYAQVRGAHAGNVDVNTYATGVSLMGNLDTAGVGAAMAAATVKLVGWRLGTFWIPVDGGYRIAGGALQRIAGHRDVYDAGIRPATSTACPGRYGYAWMIAKGGLRDRVRSYISRYSTPNRTRAAQLGSATVGYPHFTEYASHGGIVTQMTKGDMYSTGTGPAHFMAFGALRTEYLAVGHEVGALGFPTTDVTSVGSTGVSTMSFVGGAIYSWTRDGAAVAYSLSKRIDAAYRANGGAAGRLGAPTARWVVASGYESATFQGGRITVRQSDGAVTVTYS